jgi:aspartate aminotransferase
MARADGSGRRSVRTFPFLAALLPGPYRQTMHLASRTRSVSGSATLALAAMVAELKRAGADIVSLGAGEPDFPTPPEAIAAAQAFVAQGTVHYTASDGLPELRAAAAETLSAITGVAYAPGQVIVTCGAKEGLALALLALVEPGDEVIVPTPAWISYEPMVALCGGKVVRAPCAEADGYKLTAAGLSAALSPRTRVLMLNSPNNPTGAVYTAAELGALTTVLAGSHAAIVSDEIYSPFVFEGRHVSPASMPGMAERTVVVNGVSKSFAMTGWRIGFLAGPRGLVEAVGNIKSHVTSNAAAPSQVAALAALRGGPAWPRRMAEAFRRRRDATVAALSAMPGVRLVAPAGAFYVFPRMDAFYGGAIGGSADFCTALLTEARVAAVPGEAFGDDTCVRFSIAAADERLAEAMTRLAGFLDTLRARAGGGAGSHAGSGTSVHQPSTTSSASSTSSTSSTRSSST